MSSPNNMSTGFLLGSSPENYLPETFFIIYLILAAILRRCGFKDCVLYSKHCKRAFDQEMFDAGVIFNLYSEYGVGKSLKPLIVELLSTTGLDPMRNKYSIFFREIIRLTPEVVNIIRGNDPTLETIWTMKYVMETEHVADDISNERILRMADLLYEIPSDPSNNLLDDLSDLSEVSDPVNNIACYCIFCHEFRKYYGPRKNHNVTEMINNVLVDITDEIKSQI